MDKKEIQELRKDLGLSQEKFAIKVGVATMTIRRWESGDSIPNKLAQDKLKHLRFRHRQNNPINHIGKTEEQIDVLDKDKLSEIRDLVLGFSKSKQIKGK